MQQQKQVNTKNMIGRAGREQAGQEVKHANMHKESDLQNKTGRLK